MIGVEQRGQAAPATLAYGVLAIGALVAVTIGSAAALTVMLGLILSAPQRIAGLPYGDVPAALIAIGTAASLASLASAAACFGQMASDRQAWRASRALRVVTFSLMSAAYLAFAIGGLAFTHFCLAAAAALARLHAGG